MKNYLASLLQVVLGLALFCLAGQCRGEEILEQGLYAFGSIPNDGSEPNRIVQGSDGWLYGTTEYGGNGNIGTIFKINTNGMGYMMLHSFTSNSVSDGVYPSGDIVVSDGWIYGVTELGGNNGAGAIYKINTDGNGFGLIHSFAIHAYGPTEGPQNLMQANNGALYGVIEGNSDYLGCVFKINPGGDGYTEFPFDNSNSLSEPVGGLVQGQDGALYGTAIVSYLGKTVSAGPGGVFKLNLDGTGFTDLFDFRNNFDPAYPAATLLQGPNGALYGTSYYGGTNSLGTIFMIGTNSPGQYNEICSFTNDSFSHSSAFPNALIQGADGALYGTTMGSGYIGLGTVFRIETNGMNFDDLYLFGGVDGGSGYEPTSMILGQDGSFYGVTLGPDLGTVFKFSVIEPTISTMRLSITFAGNHVTLSWPTNSPVGFTYNSLQSATNLSSSAVWTTLYGQVSNTNYVFFDFFMPIPGTEKFYRLMY